METAQNPGEAGVRLRTHTGLKVDLRIVAPDQFGNLMQHFTGSKEHNMALREAAVRKGLHVSEYGVLDDATGETHRCEREEEVYALLGLEYIEPELRENRGELEAAAAGRYHLITVDDLRGDLHCHTTASDGTASVEAMAQAARGRAMSTWRSPTTRRARIRRRGSPDRLREQIARIRELSGTERRRRSAAGRLGGQHPARRNARLRRRDAGRARLGGGVGAFVVRDGHAAMTARIVRATPTRWST